MLALAAFMALDGCAFVPYSDPGLRAIEGKAVLVIVTDDASEYCRRERTILGPAVACAWVATSDEEAAAALKLFYDEAMARGTGLDCIITTPPNDRLLGHEAGLCAAGSDANNYFNARSRTNGK